MTTAEWLGWGAIAVLIVLVLAVIFKPPTPPAGYR